MKKRMAVRLIAFTIPLILSGIFQQMFNWVDAFILGNAEGDAALASVGASSAIINLLIMGITGFTTGISILSARYFGNGEEAKQRKLLGSFMMILTQCTVVLSFLGWLLCDHLIRYMNTPIDIRKDAADYLRIVLLGTPFLAMYNTDSAILRGIGDSKTPFICLAVSGMLNVALDVLFVPGLHWGVSGAAIATVVSQVLLPVLAIGSSTRRYPFLRLSPMDLVPERGQLREGMRLALPVTAQSIVSAFGNILLQNFLNGFGTVTIAAITTSYRVDTVLLLPVRNMGTGISTMVSQSIGENDRRKAHGCFVGGLFLMIATASILALLIRCFGEPIVSLFGLGRDAIRISKDFFDQLSWFYPLYGVILAINGYFVGKGRVAFTSVINISALLLRVAASYALKGMLGGAVIIWAEVISWAAMLIALGLGLLADGNPL